MYKITGTLYKNNNPIWPPRLNSYIIVQKDVPNGRILAGKVAMNTKDNTAAVIHLVGKATYRDNEVRKYIPNDVDPDKYMLVIENDGWRYVSVKKLEHLLKLSIPSHNKLAEEPPKPPSPQQEPKPEKEGHNELLFDDIKPDDVVLTNKYYKDALREPDKNVPLYKILNLEDLDDFSFLTDHPVISKLDFIQDNKASFETFEQDKSKIKDYVPAIVSEFRSPIINFIENDEKPVELLVTDQAMITSLVDSEETLLFEGKRLIKKLRRVLIEKDPNMLQGEKLFGSLIFVYYGGYVHAVRKGMPLKELITHDLLGDTVANPRLKKIGLECYDRPIRHNLLKYMLFQNDIQKSMLLDREMQAEAELVLSQEYVMALTPEPRYQLWCFITLIKLWYADEELQNNIRKVKLLVNQWRARADQPYNIENGIKYSIGIHVRYGKKSAKIVLKKLNYYFAPFIQAIGWKNNPPSYFQVMNDLISFTNSNQSLKLYYRRITEMNSQENRSFNDNYTKLLVPGENTGILEEYIPLKVTSDTVGITYGRT